MLIITLLLILKPYATLWQITLVKYLATQLLEDHFAEKFKSYVDERVSEFKKNAMTSDEEFNIPASLVKQICSNLPKNKTCGLDGIFYEHIKYGGSYLFFCLARLFSLVIKKTVSLVNGIMVFLFVYLRVIINLG